MTAEVHTGWMEQNPAYRGAAATLKKLVHDWRPNLNKYFFKQLLSYLDLAQRKPVWLVGASDSE